MADLALWDSHPLVPGATPQQVWIDAIAQLATPHILSKPAPCQTVPNTPSFDKEIGETLKHDGLAPLEPVQSKSSTVVFTNVTSIFVRDDYNVREALQTCWIPSLLPSQSCALGSSRASGPR